MIKALRASLCVIALLPAFALWSPRASAAVHLWHIVEVFSNHDGSVQFVELHTTASAETVTNLAQLQATSNGITKTFTIVGNLTGPTTNKRLLFATPGFGSLPGGVAPNYTFTDLPFFNPNATGSIVITFSAPGFGLIDTVSFTAASLPKDGVQSLHFTEGGAASVATNSPTNFAGAVGQVNVPPPMAAGDFNGDGRADILWRNSATGENYLYPMNGTTIGMGEGYLRTVADTNWKIAGVGDFNGDGRADVFWRNTSTGDNYIYLMNGTAIQNEGFVRTVADTSWEVVGVGDFNGDGKDDVLWRNTSTGENYVYPMDGLTILGSEGYLRTVASHHWQVAGVGKFDAGATADIVWRNSRTGENYIYLMNGTTIASEGFIRTVAALEWQIAGVGDFTGDGMADILWRNVSTGENYVFPMNGTTILGSEGYLRTVADLNWRIAGVGDYDGDTKADVLWRHASSGDNYVYPMDGTSIKATEGYLRMVADQNWKARHSSPFAIRRGEVDGFQGPTATQSSATGFTTMRMDLFTRETTGVAVSDLAITTNAHIHLGTVSQDGDPIVQMTKVSEGVWIAPAGSFMPAEHYLAFLTDGTYVNIHTIAFPAGEIRGQLE